MNNEKLKSIGKQLDVSERYINEIIKEHDREKLAVNIMFIIFGFFISGFFGFMIGLNSKPSSYPYAITSFTMTQKNPKSNNISVKYIFIGIVLSIISFIFGFYNGRDVFGSGFIYSVYSKNKK